MVLISVPVAILLLGFQFIIIFKPNHFLHFDFAYFSISLIQFIFLVLTFITNHYYL